MADCNVQTLMNRANCFNGCLMGIQWDAVTAQLLCEIKGGDCTVQTLMNNSRSLMGLSEGQLWAVIAQLTCNWRG